MQNDIIIHDVFSAMIMAMIITSCPMTETIKMLTAIVYLRRMLFVTTTSTTNMYSTSHIDYYIALVLKMTRLPLSFTFEYYA